MREVLRAALQQRRAFSEQHRAYSVVSVVGRLKNYVLGRTEVGSDETARYFVMQSGTGLRRVFELHKPETDFTDVSPEWLAWLRGTRAEPPTAEESARLAQQRESVKRNAAESMRAEALRRDRARVLNTEARPDGPADALGAGPQSWVPGGAPADADRRQ